MSGDRIITGDKELDRALARIEARASNRVVRSASARAGTVIRRAIRALIPYRSIKRSVGKRQKRSKRSGRFEAKVGFGVGAASKVRAPHAHLIAAGTKPRYTKKGAFRGKVEPRHWVEQGKAASLSRARQVFLATFRTRFLTEAARELGRAAR